MQVIGWRPVSRKILLYISDAGFHYAGDGLVSSAHHTQLMSPTEVEGVPFILHTFVMYGADSLRLCRHCRVSNGSSPIVILHQHTTLYTFLLTSRATALDLHSLAPKNCCVAVAIICTSSYYNVHLKAPTSYSFPARWCDKTKRWQVPHGP